jgi:hypothetical protein
MDDCPAPLYAAVHAQWGWVPTLPAAQALDHIKGWQRLYADDTAVIHVRQSNVDQ